MPIATATRTSILALLFNATAWADIAENDTTSPHTQIATALHTADPGIGGTMSTSEAAYTSYARVNINRTSGGFTVSGNTVVPVANIDFPAATGGTETITHASFGKTGGGAAIIFFTGTVTPNIAVTTGVTPRLTTASTVTLT